MSQFNAQSTTDQVLAGHDLSGKTAFITGGNSGLGQETARAMATKGAHVVIAGRDQTKLDEAKAAIEAEVTGANVETIVGDLGSLESVRGCGKEANERFEKIDLLINNAGVMACPLMHTADGFEMQFGTNHLGHFALTKHLMPLLEKGESKRIVNLSSRGHHMGSVDLDDPNFENREYNKWSSYGQAKTANILFSVGLEKRFANRGIHAYAVHPGGIQTNLGRHLSEKDIADLLARVTTRGEEFSWKTIPQGAATTCWAATASELAEKGGVYCEDCHVAKLDDRSSKGGVRSYAVDPNNAEQLWRLSEKMISETFDA